MSNSLDDYEVRIRIPDATWREEAATAFALLAAKMLGEHMPHNHAATYEILGRALGALSVPFAGDADNGGRGDMTAAGALYCLLGRAAILDQSYDLKDRQQAAQMRRDSLHLYKDACGPVDS